MPGEEGGGALGSFGDIPPEVPALTVGLPEAGAGSGWVGGGSGDDAGGGSDGMG